ncbi:hypothetical protein [Streptomyces sp. SID13031]|uniref:hypothetical protein n=1 Tax=Streptomyces sp. SID13031 TaxID=2706046 RepID=UPI0013CBF57A|nr:hypothetical protein [Streptomyces sp. SID13031]NEA33051.1 hypothetical protein [Streptomyces sp. SID13031]
MPDPESDLLIEYVEEQTPEEAPPFEYVAGAARRRRRNRKLVIAAATIGVVAGAATIVAVDAQRAEVGPAGPPTPTSSTPEPGSLDVGPPPAQFKQGTTLLTLDREIEVTSVSRDPVSPSRLIVQATRGDTETCTPHVIVRVLEQDTKTIRVAAYRYSVLPQSSVGMQCFRPQGEPLKTPLDLHWQVGNRRVLAGSAGNRVVLN